MAKKVTAPLCAHCGRPAALVTGADVYGPRRPDLADKWLWRCDPCRAWVGCHGATKRALGNRSALGIEDAERTTAALKGIVGKRLTYKALIA